MTQERPLTGQWDRLLENGQKVQKETRSERQDPDEPEKSTCRKGGAVPAVESVDTGVKDAAVCREAGGCAEAAKDEKGHD